MKALITVLTSRRRLIAILIPAAAAAYDYLAGSGENVAFLLGMTLVTAYVHVPAKYFQYQPRRRK